MHIRLNLGFIIALAGAALTASPVLAQTAPQAGAANAAAKITIDPDGTMHIPAIPVPNSQFLSPEGKAYTDSRMQGILNPKPRGQGNGGGIGDFLKRDQELYPADTKDVHIAGVHAVEYTPKAGISPENAKRVLINLHGGGFSGCWKGCSELESLPIAGLGRIKVIAVDYRESPDYSFPAGSEDVAAVYRELLKTYPAKNIGIYGCSAGGMLTGESIAWFQTHDLPMPGAIGMFCSGLTMASNGFGGDAGYVGRLLGEGRVPSLPDPNKKSSLAYFQNADAQGPLISVAKYPDMLAKFPPSLVITGTRDFAMSSAVFTHSQLVKAGAQSDLHVWEGMFHGFFYNPDVPESQDCYRVIVQFFAHNLAGR